MAKEKYSIGSERNDTKENRLIEKRRVTHCINKKSLTEKLVEKPLFSLTKAVWYRNFEFSLKLTTGESNEYQTIGIIFIVTKSLKVESLNPFARLNLARNMRWKIYSGTLPHWNHPFGLRCGWGIAFWGSPPYLGISIFVYIGQTQKAFSGHRITKGSPWGLEWLVYLLYKILVQCWAKTRGPFYSIWIRSQGSLHHIKKLNVDQRNSVVLCQPNLLE